jgi:hypothetical protein
MNTEDKIDFIKMKIGKHFRTFGVGSGPRNPFAESPVTFATRNRPLSFAADVDVDEVVRFVIAEYNKV